ncbi:glutamine amidotransferase [Ensifer adhaerens]|uniref:glutamine amidotransferase n=1 Tax=Ensifer adhaerens TaxID=106592 RepID=UPI001CBEBA99|nr:glutamine amidotransferase [Ensifer adhaerens]MBZ7921472.1 glutamine amidotransferase [Ensifer adhaerens]UAX93897.1 glutamine amidotransferase [Ensifer adhaerens]UAY01532.1 glutamine amidotransferase [Ensifer adhaerens]UAY08915.1 glutamine amidotransferase [Ensifer adhaerens]
MLKTAVAIRHIHFEDLGTFEAVLSAAGYRIHYYDLGIHELWTLDPLLSDLLVVLGGPVGVYETDTYPFLVEEQRLLKARLAVDRPTLGICLGAQQIAATLGAKVESMGTKEIGFSELALTDAGRVGPLKHLEGVPVLHWHGDAFQLPDGAETLATTALCGAQGFALGRNVLGLQFHPEVDACVGIERWLIGHAAELTASGIDRDGLRADAVRFGPVLRNAARKMFAEWLQGLAE